ncbi:hypothetical protein [Cytobacillus sp. BC1816]|uniref:hypothetical protein n=1 Tax=Cytobacillus sp. BC1816 TaxID=3440154 RepID=UPI003F516F27
MPYSLTERAEVLTPICLPCLFLTWEMMHLIIEVLVKKWKRSLKIESLLESIKEPMLVIDDYYADALEKVDSN